MEQQKAPLGVPYPEPPPPYTSQPVPPSGYPQSGVYGGAGMAFFPGPSHHPPPPGGVPVFPMAGYQPHPPSSTMVVSSPAATPAMTSVTVVNVAHWGPYPTQITCPHCGVQVLTETTARTGLLTLLLSGALIFLGCWLGCCLIPCCIPECQDIDHRCPNCKAQLGTFARL